MLGHVTSVGQGVYVYGGGSVGRRKTKRVTVAYKVCPSRVSKVSKVAEKIEFTTRPC